ncbi:hypothetical protein PC128_g567 [Phytophthora cactorum]|nr:hypothetical protein PC128_g567 [Phytophthora cactorum]
MLCYPAQRENPRLLEFIDDSLKTDLSDIKGTYIAPGGNFWIDGQYKFSLRGTKSTYDYGTNNMNKALPSRKPAILESPPPTKSMGDLNSDIVIRQFRVEDLPQVVEVFEAGIWSYEAFRAIPEESEAYLQESLSSDLSDIEGIYITPGGNLWVATLKPDPTKVLGFVGLEPKDNKEGELRRMSVKDTHRRFGVGRKLIAALEKWAHENGFRKSTAITVVSEDPYFEAYTFENLLDAPLEGNPFSAEDLELVVTLLKDGMMHYPAHKIHAEVLHQHIKEALTTGDLRSIEATYINPGGNFWVAIPRSEPAEVLLIKVLEDWAKQHGYQKIWLSTGAVMEKAHAFYACMGYTQTESIVITEDPHMEGVLFEKKLDKAAIALVARRYAVSIRVV